MPMYNTLSNSMSLYSIDDIAQYWHHLTIIVITFFIHIFKYDNTFGMLYYFSGFQLHVFCNYYYIILISLHTHIMKHDFFFYKRHQIDWFVEKILINECTLTLLYLKRWINIQVLLDNAYRIYKTVQSIQQCNVLHVCIITSIQIAQTAVSR